MTRSKQAVLAGLVGAALYFASSCSIIRRGFISPLDALFHAAMVAVLVGLVWLAVASFIGRRR